MPNPSRNRLGPASPTATVRSAKSPPPRFLKKRRRLAVEVGHEQVGPAVAVEVGHGRPHAGLEGTRGVAGDARRGRDLLEPQAAQVAQEVVGRRVVGDEQVDAPVVVEVRGDDPEPPAVAVDEPASAVTSTKRPPSLRKRWSGRAGNELGMQ